MDDGQKKIWICLLIVVLANSRDRYPILFQYADRAQQRGILIRAAHGQCEAVAPAATSEEACRRVILLSEEDNNGI